jgi:uncharacterized membrane protein
MAAGYGLGALLQLPRARRRPLVLGLGAAASSAFLRLRLGNGYSYPRPWQPQASRFWTVLAYLNCTEYPPCCGTALPAPYNGRGNGETSRELPATRKSWPGRCWCGCAGAASRKRRPGATVGGQG